MKRLMMLGVCAALVLGIAWGYKIFTTDVFKTGYPLKASGESLEIIDDNFSTTVLPDGWVHSKFFKITPTDYTMVEDDGRRALGCTTDDSGSILVRETFIALSELPILSWNWKIVNPIESEIDEDTKDGDDHPARFFLRFENEKEEMKATEIIWSNKKHAPGDYKIIGDFYHYVANGLNLNVGIWHSESVDLRKLYKEIGGTGTPVLNILGFFCDSDNTGANSAALFSDVILSKATP